MVGSDCSFIFCLSRLTNTAATRVRSSARLVSFSMMEARMMSCSGVLTGRSGTRPSPPSPPQPILRLPHPLDNLLAREAAIEMIAVGQQGALAGNLPDVAGQDLVFEQARHDLLGGQPLRHGE